MLVTCLRTTTPKNTGYAVVYAMWSWPERTLKHRGWLKAPTLYVREATAEEKEYVQKSPRFEAYRYHSLEGLAADEQRCGFDITSLIHPSTLRRLREEEAGL